MRYEDLSTGIHLLHKGVEKLLKYGMPTFELYCDEVGISFCDRNRIISKCRMIAPGKFNELQCPKKLHGDRWNWFKKMRYTEKEAREMISRSDAYFKDPFTPGDPTKLMGV